MPCRLGDSDALSKEPWPQTLPESMHAKSPNVACTHPDEDGGVTRFARPKLRGQSPTAKVVPNDPSGCGSSKTAE